MIEPSPRKTAVEHISAAAAFGLIALLAAGLRLQQLSIQWLMDDEWHALHKLLSGAGYADIASSFGSADYSIPLTLLYRLLLGDGTLPAG